MQTQWTETRALWNRGQYALCERIREVEKALPFAILGFDCDNGGEFLNWHLAHYFLQRPVPVGFTRSRPYRKNDNARVEQKNWTHVRQLVGYGRLGEPAQAELLNGLYAQEWGLVAQLLLSGDEASAHGGGGKGASVVSTTSQRRLLSA